MLLPSLQLIVDLLSLLLDEQSLHIVVLLLVVRTTRACGRCVGARLHRALAHGIIVDRGATHLVLLVVLPLEFWEVTLVQSEFDEVLLAHFGVEVISLSITDVFQLIQLIIIIFIIQVPIRVEPYQANMRDPLVLSDLFSGQWWSLLLLSGLFILSLCLDLADSAAILAHCLWLKDIFQ